VNGFHMALEVSKEGGMLRQFSEHQGCTRAYSNNIHLRFMTVHE
jgi:hypothetical protein